MSKKKSAFRLKKEKEIIYPTIHKCSLIESNDYWRQLFNDISRGMCPKGITIKNGIITGCISRKNNIIYNFINDNEFTIQKKFKDLFSSLLKSEYQNNKKENDVINDYYNDFKKMDWKNIKKKNIKDFIIQNYTVSLKEKYDIKLNKLQSIYNTILDAIYIYKSHSNFDIEYENGVILNIKDIEYDPLQKTIVNKRLEADKLIIKNNENYDIIDPVDSIETNDSIEDESEEEIVSEIEEDEEIFAETDDDYD